MNKEVELVDLVDSSGVICKRSVPRSETDLYPKLHLQIVIGVVFDKEGKVLVHRRAQIKKVNPGDIDHICGGIMSGETPEIAAAREAREETGVEPIHLRVIASGINKYNRYRYLLVGEAETEPGEVNPAEVEWVCFIHPNELKLKSTTGDLTFVDEFFEDTDLALKALNNL
jgi:8-oxo-dGTP pyrophosphatase MutT (NUDIX family)